MSDNFNSFEGGLKKMAKKGPKYEKNIFACLQISKCDMCLYMHFSKAFKKYSF